MTSPSTLTNARASPIFSPAAQPSAAHAPFAAFVSVTVTATRAVFTSVQCERCGYPIMRIPGVILFELRRITSMDDAGGRGRVVYSHHRVKAASGDTRNCGGLYEIIEHGTR